MNTEKIINKDSGQFQTKDSVYHRSNAEIDRLAKEWLELVIAHIKCPIESKKAISNSLLSYQEKGVTVKGDDDL